MSYMIEFPPGSLPPSVRSPPYVMFGIQGQDISDALPRDIPLALVLHFGPKLKEWVFPPPENLPLSYQHFQLRKPFVGINIPGPISSEALLFILNRMLQTAGLEWRKESFMSNLATSFTTDVVKAWRLLELPVEGIRGLETHMLMRMSMGPPVILEEIQAVWDTYSITSPILRETVHSFIRGHLEVGYDVRIYSNIQRWISEDRNRKKFFASFESYYQGTSGSSTNVAETEEEGKKKFERVAPAPMGPAEKGSGILEKDGTRKVSPQERKNRERKDALEMERRLRRLRSDDSLRSIETQIFAPEPKLQHVDASRSEQKTSQHGGKDKAQGQNPLGIDPNRLSSPVDVSSLVQALTELRIT